MNRRRTVMGRHSKFSAVQGKKWERSKVHENLKVGSGHKLSSIIKTNGDLFAIPYEAAGGVMAFHQVDDFVRWSQDPSAKEFPSLIRAHPKPISDFEFCPHADHNRILATTSADETVKLWDLDLNQKENSTPKIELSQEGSLGIPNIVRFHPLVANMLYTCQSNMIHFWDYEHGKKLFSFEHMKGQGQCMSTDFMINYLDGCGDVMLTGSSDKMARIWDIRSNQNKVAEVEAHGSLKPYTILSVGRSSQLLFSVGFSKSGSREYALWDVRKVQEELQRVTIDNSASVMNPFYDQDTHLLYLAGRGDGNIRYYEIDDSNTKFLYISEYQSEQPQAGIAMMPKTSVDVNKFELSRFLKLCPDNTAHPISFGVLRKDNIEGYFQEDIYPDTWNLKTTMSIQQFNSGQLAPPKRISLKPEDKVSIYDVPVEQGGKERPAQDISIQALHSPSLAVSPTALDDSLTMVDIGQSIRNASVQKSKSDANNQWLSLLYKFGLILWLSIKLIGYTLPIKLFRLFIPKTIKPPPVKIHVKDANDVESISKVVESLPLTTVQVDRKTGEATVSEHANNSAQVDACRGLSEKLIIKPHDFQKKPHERDGALPSVQIDPIDVKKGRQPMLMRVKGRRTTRVIWMPCRWQSLNQYDSFILDLGNKIFQFNGANVNRMAAAKALDVCSTIKFKERGGDALVLLLVQGKTPERSEELKFCNLFWKTVGCQDEADYLSKLDASIGMEMTDDEFPITVDRAQFLYRVNSEALENSVRNQQEDEQAFLDRVKCDSLEMVNYQPDIQKQPIQPSHHSLLPKNCYLFESLYSHEVFVWTGKHSSLQTRSWALVLGRALANYRSSLHGGENVCFTRIIDSGENTIFKQKFSDYPAETMINTGVQETVGNIAEKKKQEKINVNLLFKGLINLKKKQDLEISFQDARLEIFRIKANEKISIPKQHMVFDSNETYIIQHTFNRIKGGKDLITLYFWQGRDCGNKDKGTVALQTIEVSKEFDKSGQPENSNGSIGAAMVEHQVRVEQGKEPEDFLNLFKNHYVVKDGANQSSARLFDIRDGVAVECQRSYLAINQYACFASDDGAVVKLWFGNKSSNEERQSARLTVDNILCNRQIQQIDDLCDFEFLSGTSSDVFEFTSSPTDPNRTVRSYVVDDATGTFTVDQVPMSQEHLESEKCYLVDDTGRSDTMFLWVGHLCNTLLKKFALETCVEYSLVSKPKQQLCVFEHREPWNFKILFQSWSDGGSTSSKQRRKKYTQKDFDVKTVDVQSQLDEFKTKEYSYEILKSGSLPEGVDSTLLEIYLSDQEFVKVFEMDRQKFNKLPNWQKVNHKKRVGLF
ncbi:hypothetical protein AKO1_007892 [Acrasis kona]|uniref:HP domain-containing protein n=1 Tax=Acrasis kona TaxID=1008807 RepID=A0AAW2YP29_9EUKA